MPTITSPYMGANLAVSRGWWVFPCDDGGKKARIPWMTDCVNTLDGLNRLANKYVSANWAVNCGRSGLCVVDLDRKNRKDGVAVFEAWCKAQGEEMPITYKVLTPSGGEHHYFAGTTRSRNGWMEGVDVKSEGGYVLLPGSIIDGVTYAIEDDGPIELLPRFISEGVGAKETPKAQAKAIITQDYDAAATYLSQFAIPAIELGGGDLRTFKTVCTIRAMGVPEDRALGLMMAFYNPRCMPPWEESDMALKVKSAYGGQRIQAQGASSWEAAAEAFSECPLESQLMSLDMLVGPAPETPWLIKDWFPMGPTIPTLLTGDGGSGKTLLLIHLAVAIRTGTPWCGMMPVNTVDSVLMVLCEDGVDEIHRRVERLWRKDPALEETLKTKKVHFTSRVGKDAVLIYGNNGSTERGDFYHELDANLATLPGRKLLIIDTAADIFAGDECDRSTVNQLVKNHLIALCVRHNATLILSAHPAKATGSTFSGSTAWNNSFRNRVFLQHFDQDKKDDFRKLSIEKSNYSKAGTEMILKWENGVFVKADCVEALAADYQRVYEIIEECEDLIAISRSPHSPNYFKKHEFKTLEGKIIPSDTVEAAIRQLIGDGLVEDIVGRKHHNGLHVTGKFKPMQIPERME